MIPTDNTYKLIQHRGYCCECKEFIELTTVEVRPMELHAKMDVEAFGWTTVGHLQFCPKHEVVTKIYVDGEGFIC